MPVHLRAIRHHLNACEPGNRKAMKTAHSTLLLREVHLADQFLEARVGAEGVEFGIDSEKRRPPGVLGYALLETLEGLVPLAQGGVGRLR